MANEENATAGSGQGEAADDRGNETARKSDEAVQRTDLGALALGGHGSASAAGAAFPGFLEGGRRARGFAPGRTEIAGNHVDHQGGTVLTAALARGVEATACENGLDVVRVVSEGFPAFTVDLASLRDEGPAPDLRGSSKALVAGMIMGMEARRGKQVGGFDMLVRSDLPAGGGLSSSAAFELAVGALLNLMFFGGAFGPLELAHVARDAEETYFGKPCGMMDQVAIAFGGLLEIDFSGREPRVSPIGFDFGASGAAVVLVDVHADHAQATPAYASIPRDMAAAAGVFGAQRLGDVDEFDIVSHIFDIRHLAGDRAALRAVHYVREMNLVRTRADALRREDIAAFCEATALSGQSSAQYLQNISEPGADRQPAMIALGFADLVLDRIARDESPEGSSVETALMSAWPRGVARIHGGGFGGSIQVYLPSVRAARFAEDIDALLGPGSADILLFSPEGARARWL